MKNPRLISILMIAASFVSPTAATAVGSTTVTREQVATAIGGAGVQVSPEQVTLLSRVAAASSVAALKVDSIEPWGTGRAKARLSCVLSTDCLPFMVVVDLRKQVAGNTDPWNSNHEPEVVAPTRPAIGAPGVRAGSPVVLLLDGAHVHIQITAVSLESGALGQTIRVASKDRKQTYTAVVGEDQIVRGRL